MEPTLAATSESMSLSDFSQLVPGVIISCRDEHWLVSNVALTADGFRIRARGVSDYVRDTTATFFTALDDIAVFDPANVAVTPGESSLFRHIRLWLESTLRRTPVPLYQKAAGGGYADVGGPAGLSVVCGEVGAFR